MRHKLHVLAAALSGVLLAAIPAVAHHSFNAEFDASKEVTVKGTIDHVDWTNPHVYWYLNSKDEKGQPVTWTFQSYPPGMLHRAGVSKASFKVGEQVTVIANPAKDGTQRYGSTRIITFADGHEIKLDLANEFKQLAPAGSRLKD